jgi:hypothetical protein
MIPLSVTNIGAWAFRDCSGLKEVTIPANIAEVGGGYQEIFQGVTTLERVTLIGAPLNLAVVKAVGLALAPGAKVISQALAGQEFGRFAIIAAP